MDRAILPVLTGGIEMKAVSTRGKRSRLAAVAAGVLLLLSPVAAEVVTIKGAPGNLCVNPECLPHAVVPVIQDATTDYTLVGNWTDRVARASVSPTGGVSATFDTPKMGLLDTSSIRMRVAVTADATPGERVITLTKSDGSVPDAQPMKVKVVVVRKGAVTGAPVTYAQTFFNEAEVRLVGHNIANAGVDVDMPGVISNTVVSNSETELVVKLKFSSRVGDARGRIRLNDTSAGCFRITCGSS